MSELPKITWDDEAPKITWDAPRNDFLDTLRIAGTGAVQGLTDVANIPSALTTMIGEMGAGLSKMERGLGANTAAPLHGFGLAGPSPMGAFLRAPKVPAATDAELARSKEDVGAISKWLDVRPFVENTIGLPTDPAAEAKRIGAEMTPLRKSLAEGTRTASAVAAMGAPVGALAAGTGAGIGHAVGGDAGALVGSLVTPIVAGRVISGLTKRGVPPPSIEELRTKAQSAYKAAEDAGVMIGPTAARNLAIDTASDMARQGLTGGAAEKLYPRATAVMQMVADETKSALTLDKAEIIRRVMLDAMKGAEAADARLISRMKTRLDRAVRNLGPADVLAGDVNTAVPALTAARESWSKMAKAETIESLMERAHLSAGKFTGSGLENAIRTEFRNFAKRKREMAMFTPEEQAMIKRVAEGSLVSNVLRNAGRFAIRGPVSGGLGLGAAAVDPMLGFGLAAMGEAGRQGATLLTKRAVGRASETMRGGYKYTQPLSKTELSMIRAAMAAAGLEGTTE